MVGPRFASKRLRSGVAALVIAGLLPLSTAGCFGNFALTRKVYQYNRDASHDKWVRWLVFLVLNVVPVYTFATMVDAFFANSIEFWTGDNPITMAPGTERVVHGPNGEVARLIVRGPRLLDVDLADSSGRTRSLTVVRESETLAAYDREGRFLMRVGDRAGAPAVLARAAN
jgi:Domain of unknown function (DUF3332)